MDKKEYVWTEEKKLKFTFIVIGVLFVATCLLAVETLGDTFDLSKPKDVIIKDKDNVDKVVTITNITVKGDEVIVTLDEGGLTMMEIYQIKQGVEVINKEKMKGKFTLQQVKQ